MNRYSNDNIMVPHLHLQEPRYSVSDGMSSCAFLDPSIFIVFMFGSLLMCIENFMCQLLFNTSYLGYNDTCMSLRPVHWCTSISETVNARGTMKSRLKFDKDT